MLSLLNTLTCRICPHNCVLTSGQTGKCLVRFNDGNKISNSGYGKCSLLSVEPIEKRPFFHFHPGHKYLSVGFYGCSLTCQYCANYKVSQIGEGNYKYLLPTELVQLAKDKHADGLAFTFNEPTIYYEYLMEVAEASDLPVAIKTNGFVSGHVLSDLCQSIQAFNVDIKGDDQEYQEICGGSLKPVMEAAELIYSSGRHLEISYLITPRLIVDMNYHSAMLDWLSTMPNVPIHLLYFYPFYKMNETYDMSQLLPVLALFRSKMKNVYISNVFKADFLEHRNTYCLKCNDLMIARSGDIKVHKSVCCQ